MWHARRLSVDYESWRGAAKRELEPLGLVLKAGAWYLVARTAGRDAARPYRLASMLDVKASGRTFKRPRRFDLARTWADSAERFESELHKLRARIRVSPRGLSWFAKRVIPFQAYMAATEELSEAQLRDAIPNLRTNRSSRERVKCWDSAPKSKSSSPPSCAPKCCDRPVD